MGKSLTLNFEMLASKKHAKKKLVISIVNIGNKGKISRYFK